MIASFQLSNILSPSLPLFFSTPLLFSLTHLLSQEIAHVIPSILKGVHTTIFAYGITGSGKTHTMQGTDAQPGIIPRSAQLLTKLIASRRSPDVKITLKMSYLEIYNEKVCGGAGYLSFGAKRKMREISRIPSRSSIFWSIPPNVKTIWLSEKTPIGTFSFRIWLKWKFPPLKSSNLTISKVLSPSPSPSLPFSVSLPPSPFPSFPHSLILSLSSFL